MHRLLSKISSLWDQLQSVRPAVCTAVVATLAVCAGVANAQGVAPYPSRPVKIIMPYTPGGATDTLARNLALRLSEKWGQSVIVENKGGAGGMIGVEAVAKAAGDGYTLIVADSGPLVILPAIQPKLPYDPIKDLAPITVLARQVPVVVVNTKLPVRNIKDFVAYLKANPNTPYGSLGAGSYPHVAAEDFFKQTGTSMLHVPYKGTMQVLADMIGGDIGLFMGGTLGIFQEQEKAGKIRILAVATDKRVSLRPDLPTVSESVPGYSIPVWMGLAAPGTTPAPILDKIQRDVAAILHDKAFMAAALTPNGLIPGGESRQEYTDVFRADMMRWDRLVKVLNIKQ
jgi:tripartite-type tricarboxylate transporter receptor subunit TctC